MVPGIAPSMTRQMVQTVGQRKEDRERQHGNIHAQNGRTQRQLPFDPVRTKFYFAGEREPGPSSQGPSTPHVLAPLQQRAPALHFAQPPQFSPSQFSPPPPPPPTTASPPVPSQQHYQPQGYNLPPIRETYQRPRPELQVQSNLLPPLHLEPQEQPVPQPTPLSKVQKGKQREESIQQQPQPPPQPPEEEEEEPEPGPSTDDKGKGVEQPAQEVLEDGIAPGIDEYQTTVYKLIEEFHRVDKYGQYIMPGRAKPILYTNRRCPWAHRVHIALAELEIEYDEHTVDLDKPRTPQFLKVNPRGKVPAWSYEHTTLIESDIISSYLADRYQSHLLLPSNAPGGALQRARVSQFANSFFTRFQHVIGKLFSATTDDERAKIVEEAVSGLQAELENQLDGADPFFGGSEKLTQAEVLTASFAIRLNSLVKKTNIYPAQLWPTIEKRAPRFAKWVEAVSAHPSVTGSYDEKLVIEQARKRLATEQAAAANKKQPRAKK